MSLAAARLVAAGKQQLVDAYNLKSNIAKLTSIRRSSSDGASKHQLILLDLLRILSTLWIVIIHSYSFALSWVQFEDSQLKRDLYKSLPSQFIANGTFSVDNFFLMSGYWAYVRLRKESGQSDNLAVSEQSFVTRLASFVRSSLRRYARLMPVLLFMIWFSTSVLPKLEQTSAHDKWLAATQMFDHFCRTNWFYSATLVQNLIDTPRMCFSHSWCVAVEFQLSLAFEICVLLLKLNLNSHRPLMYMVLAVILASQITTASIVYVHDLPAFPLVPSKSLQSTLDFYSYIYIKPYHWASSYFMGIMLAKLVSSPRAALNKAMKPRWLVKSAAACLIVGLIFSNIIHFKQEWPMSRVYAFLYALFARPAWSFSMALLILLSRAAAPPLHKLAKSVPAQRLLSTLSRLSYSVYLLHPLQMSTFYGNRAETFQFSHYLLLYFVLGNIVLAYLGATLLYLAIELPCQNLTSALLSTERTTEQRTQSNRLSERLSKSNENVPSDECESAARNESCC